MIKKESLTEAAEKTYMDKYPFAEKRTDYRGDKNQAKTDMHVTERRTDRNPEKHDETGRKCLFGGKYSKNLPNYS